MAPRFVSVLLGLVMISIAAFHASAQPEPGKYATAEEAYRAGLSYLSLKDNANAQKALEEAVRLAKTNKVKLDAYRYLSPIYRTFPEIDKFLEAADFILTNPATQPERSLKRNDLLSFIHQRGKVKELTTRYEDRLKKDPDDKTALYLLTEIYDRYAPDPERGVDVAERLLRIHQKEGAKVDIPLVSQLAQQQGRLGKWKESAELFEQIAPLDKKTTAWCWKEAAHAWLKGMNKDRAVKAAKQSASSEPEKRSELLTFFWHKSLADTFLATDEPLFAIQHYEQALKHTTIDGYLRDCNAKLREARAKASKIEKK